MCYCCFILSFYFPLMLFKYHQFNPVDAIFIMKLFYRFLNSINYSKPVVLRGSRWTVHHESRPSYRFRWNSVIVKGTSCGKLFVINWDSGILCFNQVYSCLIITIKDCKDFPRESANTFAPKVCQDFQNEVMTPEFC